MILHPFQSDIVDRARSLMRSGTKNILIQSPTGSGKTVLTAFMLKTAAERGLPSFFVVHRRELVKQSMRTFESVGVPFGVSAAGFMEDPRELIQICSVGSLPRRLERLRQPRLVIWDECHHCAAGGWSKIHRALPDAFHVGLTATPERLDGTGLGGWFDEMIEGPPVEWLISNGYLSQYRMYAPTTINTDSLHSRMGDYVKSELNEIMDRPSITGDAVREYSKRANGRRAVVFCVSIKHSLHVVDQFRAAGFRAEHVDGETPAADRDAALKRFESGETQVLSNVDLFGEGFDLPSLEVSILLRPTQSLALYLQQVGRALRTSPGKDCAIILDHAGNCARHGLPDDPRMWSLEGRPKTGRSKDSDSVHVRVCPKCFAAQPPGKPVCSYCGAEFELKPREVESVDGDLEEITRDTLIRRRKMEQGQSQSLEDLVKLGRSRGYRRPELWAKHIFNYRQAKKVRGG